MRYHNITHDDMLNGDGLRTVLWVAGCTHCCAQCHNPITWAVEGGMPFDATAYRELMDSLQKDYISGVTFSGGDPLHPKNRETITALAKEIKESYPAKTIWLYTGFLWEEVKDLAIIPYLNVLVDGPFKNEQRDPLLHWRGSANQRVIDVTESLQQGQVILWCS